MSRFSCCVLLLSFLITPAAFCEDEVFDLDEIVVTATKTPHLLKDVPGSVTLITREQIEKRHADDLGDYLEGTAGLKMVRYGSLGAQSGIHLRGLLSSQTLVLLDGRVLNSPSQGFADISGIPIENIERIEIVRGPISSLYGANAVAGVINIITKAPPEEFITKFNISYGTWDTIITSLETGGTHGGFSFLITPYHRKSGGHRDNNDSNDTGVDAKFNLMIGDAGISIAAGRQEIKSGVPGARPAADPADRSTTQITFGNNEVSSLVDHGEKRRGYVSTALELGRIKLTHWLNDWRDDDHAEAIDWEGTHKYDYTFRTKSHGAEIRTSLNAGKNNCVTIGASFTSDQFNVEKIDYNVTNATTEISAWDADRTTSSFYIQDEILSGPVTIALGARWDNPSDFDSQMSPKASLLWKIAGLTNLRFSYGQSFRAPTLQDINRPPDSWSQGNPDIEPETGEMYEVGFEKAFGERFLIRTSVFYHKIDDMIAWAPTGPGGKWQPSNVNEVETTGLELETRVNFTENFSVSLTTTCLDPRQNNMETVGGNMQKVERQAAYMPEFEASLDLDWRGLFGSKGLDLNVDVRYHDETYSYGSAGTRKLDDYTLVNVEMSKSLKNGRAFLRADNVFDIEYAHQFGSKFEDRDYPMPGTSVTTGIRLEF